MAKPVRGVFSLQHLLHLLLLLPHLFSIILAPSLLLLVSLFFWCFFFTWPSSLLLLLLHLLLLIVLLLTTLLLLFILPLDITLLFHRLTPPSPLGKGSKKTTERKIGEGRRKGVGDGRRRIAEGKRRWIGEGRSEEKYRPECEWRSCMGSPTALSCLETSAHTCKDLSQTN